MTAAVDGPAPGASSVAGLTALVTGASGFLGSNLLRELHRQGWQLNVLARAGSSLEDVRDVPFRLHTADLGNAGEVLAAMPSNVDAVFHVAADTNVWARNNAAQERANVLGTRNIIEAAIARGAGRLLHTSSFATWGFQDAVLDESSPRTGDTDWINYVRTKHLAENLVKAAAQQGRLDAVILCPAHILGPGDRRNWSTMMRMVDHGNLPAIPPGGGSFADAREIARAEVTAFHRAANGRVYLLGGEDASFLELIRLVGDILGKPVPKRATPAWMLRAGARVMSLVAAVTGREPDITPESAVMISSRMRCDSGLAQRELGYRFTPIRPLVEDTIDWLRKAGMMKS